MTASYDAAHAELEDTIRRLAADLLSRDDTPLVTNWTLVIATVPGITDADTDPERGGDVDVIGPKMVNIGTVLGDLRIATIAHERVLTNAWED